MRSSIWPVAMLFAAALAACDSDDESPSSCVYDGQTFADGDRFPASDGCNTCGCDDGQVACTLIGCITSCTHDGQTHDIGTTFDAGDGCNSCTCQSSGMVVCTEIACPETCAYGGMTYEVGQSFDATDGCNSCSCTGQDVVSCTTLDCSCNVDTDWWRGYIGESQAECAVINYVCAENTTSFHNACGCGCEQASSCAQTIECYQPGCDPVAAQKQCPFSTIESNATCSAETSCQEQFEQCWRPGQLATLCGICQNPPMSDLCADDQACTSGFICDPAPCACSGQKVCVPACSDNDDCPLGRVCGSGNRCETQPCGPDSCPPNFRCDAGGCLRLGCSASESCAGYCVNGSCYAEPGVCAQPPQ